MNREEAVNNWCRQNNLSEEQRQQLLELVEELASQAYQNGLDTGQEVGWWSAQ